MSTLAEDTEWQRLDKFLVFSRFCKTRSVAAALVDQGVVRINRVPAEKISARVKPGDVLTLPLPRGVAVIRILALAARRETAAKAQSLYEEML